eukprot:CAMPEP_0119546294 /NCGR_PEP_ID=MMETSP1352-20130426/777_1 /TAXON_ID=265584 /ORGANISM="Stauroneis constricta, Strain CCMP1120" /LENGTH=303 /DNA_ID=CAMNT_0007590983 /DNA_START=77 /DNA_END=988 /DNA_ORIENTATION=-
MLRSAASSVVKRAVQRSFRGAQCQGPRMAYHFSARREEEAKGTSPSTAVVADDGFLGTGLSHLYALPVGIAFAVPAIQFEWYLVNEETLLASTIVAFCVVAYNEGGDLISKSLKDEAAAMLKVQNDAEDEVISKLQENLEYMKLTENIVNDYQAVFDQTQESYGKLNAAGKVKPQHDLKAQVEKMLAMISNEESNVYEKAKTALMDEATISVTQKFASDKALKKAALESAIAKLTGKKSAKGEPVQTAFIEFFQEKGAAAKKADDGSEEAERRSAMLAKLNGIAESEGMLFRFDETGNPKLVA